ncbi:MAG: NRDE family protein [Bradymonadales bacterium]|nr:NRDE family protein [Bradymonadales bacterium]
MCTLLVLYKVHPQAPLILAANRDEFFDRPATDPRVLREDSPRIAGGMDLRHGGTWLGLNETGLVAALTNVRSDAPEGRSRGQLVLSVLGCRRTPEATQTLARLVSQHHFRPFNLLYGTPDDLVAATLRQGALHTETVARGRHVLVSSGSLDDREMPKAIRASALLDRLSIDTSMDGVFTGLQRILSDHQMPEKDQLPLPLRTSPLTAEVERRIQAICVHTPVYGTCSSTILAIGGDRVHYLYCRGAPCQGDWQKVESLLNAP